MSEHAAQTVEVPRSFIDEVAVALRAATVIGKRERAGLNLANHDRLIREAGRLTGWDYPLD